MTTDQIEQKAQESYINYCYWLDYTSPQGEVYDTAITEARAQWKSWERELKQSKRKT